MSPLERRTPLGRGSKPLARGKGLSRGTAPLARRASTSTGTGRPTRRRDTGPTAEVRAIVDARAGGRCELCQHPLAGRPWSRHHRKPRRMGGTRAADINTPSNLLVVCGTGTSDCHGRLEANRRVSYAAGWLLHAGDDPTAVPVELAIGLVWLLDDGTYSTTPPTTAATSPGAP